MDREQIMKVIQETLRGLRPPVTLVRRVSYPEGRPPLVYAPIGPGPAEPVTRPIVYPNGKEKWNFISQYELDQALDTALGSLVKESAESHASAKRSLSDEACSLINRAESIAVAAKGLLGSSSASQSLLVAASSLASAAMSLADAAQSLIEKSDVNDLDDTLVYDERNEEYDSKGCRDVLTNVKDVGVAKIKAEEIN